VAAGDVADEGLRGAAAEVRPWNPGVVGLLVGAETDWDEVAELVAESHRLRG